MGEIFRFDTRTGSLRDHISGTIPVNTGVEITRTEKGRAASFGATDELNGFGVVSGVKSIELWLKPSANGDILLDDGAAKISLVAGNVSGTGLTECYVNNADTDAVTLNAWNHIIAEFSAGIDFATDLEIDPSIACDIARVSCDSAILTTTTRTRAYNSYLKAQVIAPSVVMNRDTVVGNFNGVSYIDCGNDASVNFGTGDFSLFGRFKSTNANPQFFIAKGIQGSTINGYGVWQNIGKLYLVIGASSVRTFSIPTALTYNDNKWHDFVATYNRAGNALLYVDGNLTPVITFDISSYTGTTDEATTLRLGTYGNPILNILTGNLSNAGIANRVLSQAEIQNFSHGIIPSNIISNWKLNERGGTTAFDSVGSNDGTWINATNQYTTARLNARLNIDGTNWNADGVTKTSGKIGDFVVLSGSFKTLEDSTGKYIECVTGGTLTLPGINLSQFVGNGYIQRLDGSLSALAGDTVDAANPTVSFANNTVSIILTAGQIIRNLTIKRSA